MSRDSRVFYALPSSDEILLPEKQIRRITLIGSESKSRIWNQIIADVFDYSVVVPRNLFQFYLTSANLGTPLALRC
ncbi:hypothetical protein E4K68_05680 [Desulfosporosinus sp. Sb-LF]|nr:hypothetical protein E4K68_05680 [Desulfosporosinus sp. Sb-LF]